MTIAVIDAEQVETIAAIADRLDATGLDQESRALRALLAELQTGLGEVPASTAGAILGVTPQTIRNWVRAGVLPGRRDPTGHFYVGVDVLCAGPDLRQVGPQPSATKALE